jgi:hypothetical protein
MAPRFSSFTRSTSLHLTSTCAARDEKVAFVPAALRSLWFARIRLCGVMPTTFRNDRRLAFVAASSPTTAAQAGYAPGPLRRDTATFHRLGLAPLATITLFALAVFSIETAAARQPAAAGAPSPSAAGNFSFDLCREAWRLRERSTKYLRFSWTQTEMIPKGMFPLSSRLAARKAGKDAAIPPADTLLKGTFGVVFSGGEVRYEEDAEVFSPELNQPYQAHDVRIFSDNRYLACFDKSVVPNSVGQIEPPGRNLAVVRERNLVPLALFFRILDRQYGQFAAENIEIEANSIVIDGHQCRVLRQSISTALTHELCVDVDRNYIPLRYSSYENGRLVSQCSVIRVSSQTPGLFTPGEWTISRFRPDGQIISEVRGVQKNCEVPAGVSAAEFELDFPAGTWVLDNIARRQYVVQKTGFTRDVPVGAGYAQYAWLMNPANNGLMKPANTGSTMSSTDTRFGPFSVRVWALLAANGVGVLLVIAFFVHRRRHSA